MGVPIPVFSSMCDIWTGNAANTAPAQLREANVPCQLLSAYASGARANLQNFIFGAGTWTHVVLFQGQTDLRDDFIGWFIAGPTAIADYIAIPQGSTPLLRVLFVERRSLGTGSDYLRAYCQRASVVGGTPPV